MASPRGNKTWIDWWRLSQLFRSIAPDDGSQRSRIRFMERNTVLPVKVVEFGHLVARVVLGLAQVHDQVGVEHVDKQPPRVACRRTRVLRRRCLIHGACKALQLGARVLTEAAPCDLMLDAERLLDGLPALRALRLRAPEAFVGVDHRVGSRQRADGGVIQRGEALNGRFAGRFTLPARVVGPFEDIEPLAPVAVEESLNPCARFVRLQVAAGPAVDAAEGDEGPEHQQRGEEVCIANHAVNECRRALGRRERRQPHHGPLRAHPRRTARLVLDVVVAPGAEAQRGARFAHGRHLLEQRHV